MQGVDLTPGSSGGFKKAQSTLSLMPGMTNIPSLSWGSEGSAEALRLVQLRIFCSECEPEAILGQKKKRSLFSMDTPARGHLIRIKIPGV